MQENQYNIFIIWQVGRFSFGNMAHFHLASWRNFIWQAGAISFGKLASIYLMQAKHPNGGEAELGQLVGDFIFEFFVGHG